MASLRVLENDYTNPDYIGMKDKEIRACINQEEQVYKGIRVQCVPRRDYAVMKAKGFVLNGTNQNVWIPNKHLDKHGNIKSGENIDYVFIRSWKQCAKANVDLGCVCGSPGWNFRKFEQAKGGAGR